MSALEDSKNLKFWQEMLKALDCPEALQGFIQRVQGRRNIIAAGRALGGGDQGYRAYLYRKEKPVEEEARELLRNEKQRAQSVIAELEKRLREPDSVKSPRPLAPLRGTGWKGPQLKPAEVPTSLPVR